MTTLVPEQSNQLTLRQIFQNNSKLKHRTSYTFERLDNISTRIHSFVKIKRSFKLFIWNYWKSQEPNLSISEVTDIANCSWIKIIIWRALPFWGLLELWRSCSWFLPDLRVQYQPISLCQDGKTPCSTQWLCCLGCVSSYHTVEQAFFMSRKLKIRVHRETVHSEENGHRLRLVKQMQQVSLVERNIKMPRSQCPVS